MSIQNNKPDTITVPDKPIVKPSPEKPVKKPAPNPFTIPNPVIKPGTQPAPKA